MKGMTVFAVIAAASLAGQAFATGNGAPSGSHYNLNIIGKENCSPADLTGSNRHTRPCCCHASTRPCRVTEGPGFTDLG